jgi:anti-anti-sigma regulatory factor
MNQPTATPTRIFGQLTRAVDEIDRVLASGVPDLTIDFSTCTFISVEGLEWLEELLLRAESLKTKVSLINVPPSIYKVFKVAHIASISRACGSPNNLPPGTTAC